MTEWRLKRFWTEAAPTEAPEGWGVALDGRPVRTPAKAPLVLPTLALAQAVAVEWNAQEGVVDPGAMPMTRAANSAIDKVIPQFDAVAADLAGYGETDLLCYRAEAPDDLVRRQAEAWDPLLDWAGEAFGARLIPVAGVMHQPQPAAAVDRLSEQVRAMNAFRLTAFSDLVSLSGSLVLALAVTHAVRDPESAWRLSRIDEDWQAALWGIDEEAAAAAETKARAFHAAAAFHELAGR